MSFSYIVIACAAAWVISLCVKCVAEFLRQGER